jgi:hypothetical protein
MISSAGTAVAVALLFAAEDSTIYFGALVLTAQHAV